MNAPEKLAQVYETLLQTFGPQHWWPGDTPFEVAVGAILTQNTNWGNVEKAIANLKEQDLFDVNKIHRVEHERLADVIRPAGYFNVKTRRLKNFINWVEEEYEGDLSAAFAEPLDELREKLLAINGVGRETADSICLYAADKLSFVVDAYTYRIFSRHQIVLRDEGYEEIREFFMDNLPDDTALYNEYHALIVRLGKEYCNKRKPLCEKCPLSPLLGPGDLSEEE